MNTRKELQEEFVSLRNAQMKRPRDSSKRIRDIYFDWLDESDRLAEIKTDDELVKAINKMKKG